MSERNRNSIVVTWIAVVFVFYAIGSLITWDFATYLAEDRVRAEEAAEYHDAYAEDRIDEICLVLDPIPMRDCIHEEIESARDHERSEQDLDAQQDMAQFTRIMGYTAAIGLLIGILSIGLIFATLRATQKMTNDTREIGVAQVRAYVSASKASVTYSTDIGAHQVSLIIKNSGQSPAKDVQTDYTVSIGTPSGALRPGGGVLFQCQSTCEDADFSAGEYREYTTTLNFNMPDATYDWIDEVWISVTGFVRYKDVFMKATDAPHTVTFEFTIKDKFKMKPQEIPMVGHASREASGAIS